MGDQMGDQAIERLILMPRRSLRAHASRLSAGAARVLEELDGFVGLREALTAAKGVHCRVINSIRGDGPKLIEIAKGDIPAMRAAYAELDLVPVVYYRQALAPRPTALDVPAVPAGAAAAPAIRVKIIDAATNRPVAGATIAAFTDSRRWTGETASPMTTGLPSSTSRRVPSKSNGSMSILPWRGIGATSAVICRSPMT